MESYYIYFETSQFIFVFTMYNITFCGYYVQYYFYWPQGVRITQMD